MADNASVVRRELENIENSEADDRSDASTQTPTAHRGEGNVSFFTEKTPIDFNDIFLKRYDETITDLSHSWNNISVDRLLGCGINIKDIKLLANPFEDRQCRIQSEEHPEYVVTEYSEVLSEFIENESDFKRKIIGRLGFNSKILSAEANLQITNSASSTESLSNYVIVAQVTSSRYFTLELLENKLRGHADNLLFKIRGTTSEQLVMTKQFLKKYGDHYISAVGQSAYLFAHLTIHHTDEQSKTNFETNVAQDFGAAAKGEGEFTSRIESHGLSNRVRVVLKVISNKTISQPINSIQEFDNYYGTFLREPKEDMCRHPSPLTCTTWFEKLGIMDPTQDTNSGHYESMLRDETKPLQENNGEIIDKNFDYLIDLICHTEANLPGNEIRSLYTTLLHRVCDEKVFTTSKIFKLLNKLCCSRAFDNTAEALALLSNFNLLPMISELIEKVYTDTPFLFSVRAWPDSYFAVSDIGWKQFNNNNKDITNEASHIYLEPAYKHTLREEDDEFFVLTPKMNKDNIFLGVCKDFTGGVVSFEKSALHNTRDGNRLLFKIQPREDERGSYYVITCKKWKTACLYGSDDPVGGMISRGYVSEKKLGAAGHIIITPYEAPAPTHSHST